MKNYKRTLAALTAGFLALSPCFAAGMTGFAEGEANTITIKNAENDADNAHDYNAYCLIKATEIDDNGLLKGIELGDNVTSLSALANALKNMKIDEAPVGEFANLNGDSSLQDIVEALEAFNENREDKDVQQLAKALSTVKTGDPKPIPQDATSKNYKATVDDIGWYLITDTKGDDTKVVSANLLQVLGTAEVNPKFSLPSIDKKIVENENKVEFNEASIGDTINYELTSAVPNMQGYDKYFFVINDTIADSLTFNPESVHVYIDNDELTNTEQNKYFRVDTGDAAKVGDVKYSFQIVMNDFIQHADKAGKPIKVTYSAVLNQKANITNAGNVNDVCLTYSNNPNVTPNGESNENPDEPKQPNTPPGTPDNPDDDYDAPVGVTPKDRVKTFTTAIKIHKIDNKNNSLIGAEFTLTGNDANIVLVSTETFTADADGTYWKLKDGKYTTTNPNTEGIDKSKYDSIDTKYKRSTELTPKGNVSTPVDIKGYVDNDGYISFIGLGAGTYTLTESKVPNGYNGIDPIEFTISNGTMSFDNPAWLINNDDFTHDGEYFNIEIKNVKGATLPSTGGIGTKLFYLFGGMLVVGSSVILITKKRMSADEN